MNESPRTWITISKMTLHRPLLLELWFPHQQHQVIGPEDTWECMVRKPFCSWCGDSSGTQVRRARTVHLGLRVWRRAPGKQWKVFNDVEPLKSPPSHIIRGRHLYSPHALIVCV